MLTHERWRHILEEHRELEAHLGAMMMAAVARPDDRQPDPRPGRERFYRQGLGPSKWLFVVVDSNQSPAQIVTAYGLSSRSSMPASWLSVTASSSSRCPQRMQVAPDALASALAAA